MLLIRPQSRPDSIVSKHCSSPESAEIAPQPSRWGHQGVTRFPSPSPYGTCIVNARALHSLPELRHEPRAVRYDMIREGDRLLVGLSGGKDAQRRAQKLEGSSLYFRRTA